MLYWNKKISQELFSTPGLQLPDNINILDSNIIIRQISQKSSEKMQRAVGKQDIANISNVMQNPTIILLDNKKYDGKPTIHFVQQKGKEKTTVVAVVSNKHLSLRVQTEYINVKKRNLATPIDEQASINTPKASRSTVSTTNIPQDLQKSSGNAKISEKNSKPTQER